MDQKDEEKRAQSALKRKRIGTLVLSSLVSLLLLEGVLRLFVPLSFSSIQDAYQYDKETGHLLRPGVHRKLTDHLAEIHVNELGTVNYQERFDDYSKKVFALGDSYTQGTGLSPDAAFPFQLDLALNRDDSGIYHKETAVINLGLAAFGPLQAHIIYRRFRDKLGVPQIVLFFGSENDADDDALFLSGYRHGHLVRGSPKWGAFVGVMRVLANLEIVKRTKVVVGRIRRGSVATGAKNEEIVAERAWPNLKLLVDEARSDGAYVILGWANHNSPSYDWLATRAEKDGIGFADWRPAFRSLHAQVPALDVTNPHSAGHWRSWVNRLIADEFARQIRAFRAPKP